MTLTEGFFAEDGGMRGLESGAGANRMLESFAMEESPFDLVPWTAAFWAEDPAVTAPANGAVLPTTWNQPGTYTVTEWARVGSPTYVSSWTGGKPAVNFDQGHRLTTEFAATSQGSVTVAVVGETTNANSDLCDANLGGSRLLLDRSSGDWRLYRGALINAGAGDALPHLFIARYFNDGQDSLYVDGVAKITGQSVGNSAGKDVYLGSSADNAEHVQSRVAFFGIVTGELTTTQRSNLLAWYQSHY